MRLAVPVSACLATIVTASVPVLVAVPSAEAAPAATVAATAQQAAATKNTKKKPASTRSAAKKRTKKSTKKTAAKKSTKKAPKKPAVKKPAVKKPSTTKPKKRVTRPGVSASSTFRMTVRPQALTTADGSVYQARSGFEGGGYNGTLYAAGADIARTTDDALYHAEWFKPAAWRKAVDNGAYDVTLKMREAYYSRAGQRVFSVDAEGRRALTDIDIIKEVGRNAALDKTFRVQVQDGRLDLGFPSRVDGAVISAIVVRPVEPAVTTPDADPAPTGVAGTWNLAVRDEFDGTSLNTSVWTPHRGLPPYTYGHPYNPSLDDYAFDPSRVSVRDGNLRLAWDKTPATVRNGDGSTTTYPYTASIAHSGKGFSMTEGYVEARIRVPETPGIWPAFWMLPTPVDQNWPPEIDIAEIIPDDTPDGLYKPHFNFHWKDASGQNRQANWKWYGEQGKSYAGGWHTYGLLREKGRLQVFIDGVPGPVHTGAEVTTDPMYVVLSSGVRKGYTPAAGSMDVDYVRLWKRG